MNKLQQILNTILSKLNFLDAQSRISLTNITVAVFVLITAFRSLFGGSTLQIHGFNWVIQTIDYSDTLPLLFGLLNYGHKRSVISSDTKNQSNINNQNAPSGEKET